MTRFIVVVLVCLSTVFGTIQRAAAEQVRVASVAVSPVSAKVSIGKLQQFSATAKDSAGKVISGVSFTWSSNTHSVATVAAKGLATAISQGTARITAAAPNGVSGSATLTVQPPVVASVTVSPSSAQIIAGQTQQLSATAEDANGHLISGVSFVWSSSATAVATVNSSGVASAVSAGTATLTATAPDGVSDSATLTVLSPVAGCPNGSVRVEPTDNLAALVSSNPAGTTFCIVSGTHRLDGNGGTVVPKTGDSFIGEMPCNTNAIATPQSCPAIISGGREIGGLAVQDPTSGYYKVTGQTQHNPAALPSFCFPGWPGCYHAEDLFFNGVPYQHLECKTQACQNGTPPVIASRQWWFDYINQVLWFSDNPSGKTVETSVVAQGFNGPANNVTFKYVALEEFANWAPNGPIGSNQTTNCATQETGWTLENSEFTLNHGHGVQLLFQLSVLNNYIHNNGILGFGGAIGTPCLLLNSQVTIQGNTITNNNYAHMDPNQETGGGLVVDNASGVTVRGNNISNNLGLGVHFDIQSGQNGGILVDGNTLQGNTDADTLLHEISFGPAIYRNNIVLENGTGTFNRGNVALRSSTSSGMQAYCNVLQIPGGGANAWLINATPRGKNPFPPGQMMTSTGNSFHHNTVIFDVDATAATVGLRQSDPVNEPNFFADNSAPDHNTYHAPSISGPTFIYDNNNGAVNTLKTFAEYQAAGADINGSIDTNFNVGFPAVSIASPADQSSFTNSTTVEAAASDKSGIAKVEFYVDWNLQQTLVGPPYTFTLQSGKLGSHTVAAMAYSNAGVRACYAVTLNKQ